MASSLISSSHNIDFDSVFSMEDESLAPVFESLITTGLKEFLGCPSIFYEAALTNFFANGSVRDGLVVSTIGGTAVEISESVFAATFELPSEGLTDLSEVPKNMVFDARSLFSDSKEQVSISCFKKELKIEYSLLHNILATTFYVKAGSFDAVTRDRFMLMTAITFDVKINWSTLLFGVLKAMVTPGSRQAKGFAIQIGVVLSNIPGLELGEPRAFPAPRVLNEKTVHRFVHINEQVGMEKTAVSPPVKKTPKNRAMSKKRPVDSDAKVASIVKKKRTTKGKPATTGIEAVPLQTIEPTADVPDEQPSKPKRKSQKRKRRLVLDDVDETTVAPADEDQPTDDRDAIIEQILTQLDTAAATKGDDQPTAQANETTVAPADEDQPTDDRDAIIEQILTQLDTAAATKGDDQPTAQAKEPIPWFDIPFILAQRDAEGILSSDTNEEFIADQPTVPSVPDGGYQPQVSGNSKPVTEEHMSIDDILMQISEDMMLPSVTAAEITKIRLGESISIPGVQERDLFYASLPRISIHDKGKEILALKAKERLMLEWAETDSLETAVRRRLDSVDIQSLQEFESTSSDGSIVYRSPSPILQKDGSFDQEELLYIVESPKSSPSIPQQQESTSSSSDSQMHFDSNDFCLDETTEARTSLPAAIVDLSSLLDDLKSSLSQRMDDDNSVNFSRLHSTERSLQTSLGHQNDYLRSLIQSARQEVQLQDDLQILRINELKKSVMAQGVKADTDSLAIRSKFNALDAKLLLLDGQVAAIRGEQLEFQAKIAADLLSLSTQIGDIVDYIRGGDAKKGEGKRKEA
ncbi:hypothetical protein F511_18844 [Dorcoceras hygrometricum]|uniref:Dystroglycan-like n=1 Tax=Dorcoceras hygrometricum TaxID=472368 RepID=A0A2Z7CA37_9LAMI|nr:hypothetical protein F511_18844 [Dorcoceras hygrometricum]